MSVSNASPREIAEAASTAARSIAILSTNARNDALTAIHTALSAARESILAANARDVEAAAQAVAGGKLNQSVLKRLDLSRIGKYDDMLQGVLDVRDLKDPVGKTTLKTKLDDDLILERVTAPIGVLLIIFEARPEVIANIAALAIKSGNAAILKGGKESTESFVAISTILSNALETTGVPNAAIQLVTTRDVIPQLLALDRFVDLVIPRGSNELVSYVKNNTKIPVLGHADGLCSMYLCADADADMAVRLALDGKLSYTAACNSIETLLVDEDALKTVLPPVATALVEKGVELRCDAFSKAALHGSLPEDLSTKVVSAQPADFETEFLDLILAVKTIPKAETAEASVDLAVTHINAHSSKHTDVIVTQNANAARRFQMGVDSAGVYWNASSRFADGMRYGFGTEVGVSTNKIHARGPVGLEGLMSYKYFISGGGQSASEYHDRQGGKCYKHESLCLN